jgi:hypothetical protein
MTTTTLPTGTYPRGEVDLTEMRPVASIIMDGGRNPAITVYEHFGYKPRFYVDTPGTPVVVGVSTIRAGIKLALRNGGWG